jgi:hypothetical protein
MATDTFRDPALERRLQRKASAKGSFVATFRQVFLRHGLTMGFVALACLFLPSTLTAIRWGSVSLLSAPFFYFDHGGVRFSIDITKPPRGAYRCIPSRYSQ